MKWAIVASALLVLVVLVAGQELYSSENDDLDIEAVVGDPLALKAFLDCFTDKGPCDAVSGAFKKDLPEAVGGACAKCTAAQKHLLRRFLEALKQTQPAGYRAFQRRYDERQRLLPALEAAVAGA